MLHRAGGPLVPKSMATSEDRLFYHHSSITSFDDNFWEKATTSSEYVCLSVCRPKSVDWGLFRHRVVLVGRAADYCSPRASLRFGLKLKLSNFSELSDQLVWRRDRLYFCTGRATGSVDTCRLNSY